MTWPWYWNVIQGSMSIDWTESARREAPVDSDVVLVVGGLPMIFHDEDPSLVSAMVVVVAAALVSLPVWECVCDDYSAAWSESCGFLYPVLLSRVNEERQSVARTERREGERMLWYICVSLLNPG